MEIPKNVLAELKSHINDDGIVNVSKSSKIHYSVMKPLLDSGHCSSKVLAKIVAFLKKKKKQLAQIENDLN